MVLMHHGIKGQKWGVRRYQNPDGSYTNEGRARYRSASRIRRSDKTAPKVQQIIDTMTEDEKNRLGLNPNANGQYIAREDHALVCRRILMEIGDKPVAFFDVFENQDAETGKGRYDIAIGVSHDEQGKGYGTKIAKQGMKYVDKLVEENDLEANWGPRKDNKASIALAKKYGFEYDSEDDGWANYVKRPTKSMANDIYTKAKQKEPGITKDIQKAAKSSNSKLYGLENRLKTKESIARKINSNSLKKDISTSEAANDIKDAVRYTTISSDKSFVKNYNDFKSSMEKNGYKETRCKNYWDLYDKGEVKHKSVQSIFQDKDGYSFEVQFQTPSSQTAKDKKTPIYEARRKPGISKAEAASLEKQMEELAKQVSTPNDIYKIKSH